MSTVTATGLAGIMPELVVTPTVTEVFSYSAVTWNRHMIHYSKDAALAEGHKDIVVQRALLGNYLARLVEQWLGEHGEVRRLSWKVLSSAVPGNSLHCRGKASIDGSTAHCELTIVNDLGTEIATGKAECMLKGSTAQ